VNLSALPPPPKSSKLGAPDDTIQPVLTGKGILNVDGVLHHEPGLFPKKPFDEIRVTTSSR
jgi:hypothetical protein